jgi:hypothetical protein
MPVALLRGAKLPTRTANPMAPIFRICFFPEGMKPIHGLEHKIPGQSSCFNHAIR